MIQAFLILTTLFLQEQAILPNTLGTAQNSTAEIERLASLVQSGWGIDPTTRKFVFTIQIPPESLAAFTAGRFGNDLGAPIPPDIRPFVEEVIVRIGTGPVPRTAPTPEMRAALNRTSQPMMAMLDDRRSLTDIDPVLPASGQGGLGTSGFNNPGTGSTAQGNGNILPPGMSPSTAAAPSTDAPSLLNGSGVRQTNPLPTMGGIGVMPSTNPNPMSSPSGIGSTLNNATAPTAGRTDGFRPDSNTSSMLGRLTGGVPPLPSTNPTTGAGSLSTPYASSNPAVPRVASNPLPNQGSEFGASAGYNPALTTGTNTGIHSGVNQGYGSSLPPANSYDPRLAAGFSQSLSNPQTSALPSPSSVALNPNGASGVSANLPPTMGNPSSVLSPADTQPGVTFDKLLPLITLMLLVINIYQFFWMAHVRTRYKEMVISKRTAQLNLSNT